MGIDGLAMVNLGLPTESTSSQMANQAEELALRGSEIQVKDIEKSDAKDGINVGKDSRKKHDEGKKKKQKDQSLEEKKLEIEDFDFEHDDSRNYSVKINPQTELIELIDNNTQKIIETITADELVSMISKLDNVEGIFVNKKI